MASRKETFKNHFGPKLAEAIASVIKDEINLLRAEHSLAERTDQQVMDKIKNKVSSLADYED